MASACRFHGGPRHPSSPFSAIRHEFLSRKAGRGSWSMHVFEAGPSPPVRCFVPSIWRRSSSTWEHRVVFMAMLAVWSLAKRGAGAESASTRTPSTTRCRPRKRRSGRSTMSDLCHRRGARTPTGLTSRRPSSPPRSTGSEPRTGRDARAPTHGHDAGRLPFERGGPLARIGQGEDDLSPRRWAATCCGFSLTQSSAARLTSRNHEGLSSGTGWSSGTSSGGFASFFEIGGMK